VDGGVRSIALLSNLHRLFRTEPRGDLLPPGVRSARPILHGVGTRCDTSEGHAVPSARYFTLAIGGRSGKANVVGHLCGER
jgi:hypothetical protein